MEPKKKGGGLSILEGGGVGQLKKCLVQRNKKANSKNVLVFVEISNT